jgi:TRAP-type C4-dicarboxylate transport system permease small subunit
MKNWPALLVAPTLALSNLAITYALVTPSCSRQDMLAPRLVSALLLILCAWMSWGAWRNWAGAPAHDGRPGDAAPARKPFVALVALMSGSLSCLVVIAQWFPQWVLSPCAN